MRLLIAAVLSTSLVLAGCSSDSDDPPSTPTSPTTPACTYSVSTSSFSISGAGGSATLSVNTGTGCAWSATSNNSFISISSVSTTSGPGTVTFSLGENPGDTRTGTLTVAGQTVTVSQVANDQVYGNWGGTIVKGSGCPATLPASVEWSGVIRRTSGATNEFVITIPGLVTSLALNLVINGSSLQFAVPIDALYTFNGTLSGDRRSVTGTFAGGTCSGTWSGSRR